MRVLLDTHSFLWFIFGDQRLSERAQEEIASERNELLLSTASLWEIAIKVSLGKLTLGRPYDTVIGEALSFYSVERLPINLDALNLVTKLPFHHRDPFDRLIIAQALSEDIPIVTRDSVFAQYPVAILW